jgi:Amt family ammonium transporter
MNDVALSLLYTIAKIKKEVAIMNSGDTAWVLTASALVLLMTIPGLAFFYGGLVRRKNVLSILMQCFIVVCVISLQWMLFGYSLAFGPSLNGIIGNLDWMGLSGVGAAPSADYGTTIPHYAFMMFQAMFAIITPALMIGAFAERMKFSAFLLFIILWSTLVYDPLAHWVWNKDGWLGAMGALDFAGGIVVHVSSGISALVLAIMLGKRIGYNHKPIRPHNLPFTILGGALLWFGWFGFNAGSSLAADGLAAQAMVATQMAAAAAGLTWALVEWWHNGSPTVLGAVTGAIGGLVAITPACGFVSPMSAMLIGIIAGMVCYLAVAIIKGKLGYDDSLDAFGVHGVGGIFGTMAVGLFAQLSVNSGGADGLLFGNIKLFMIQGFLVVVAVAFAAVMTFILYKLVDVLLGMRVEEKNEIIGLDLTQQSESAYTVIE